jgi:hypothetical protein
MANKYMKKYSTSLDMNKMQVKMALWFHLTPVIMAIIQKTNNKCWQVHKEEEIYILLVGMWN